MVPTHTSQTWHTNGYTSAHTHRGSHAHILFTIYILTILSNAATDQRLQGRSHCSKWVQWQLTPTAKLQHKQQEREWCWDAGWPQETALVACLSWLHFTFRGFYSSSGAVLVRHLAQGHLVTPVVGAGERTSNLPATSQPALPHELLPPDFRIIIPEL